MKLRPETYKEVLRDNSLSLALFGLFAIFIIGQFFSGFLVNNQELAIRRLPQLTLGAYFTDGHFLEAVFENWESEFLQMGLYVLLTVFLFQRGSSESKNPDGGESVDEDPALHKHGHNVPWPVRKGGIPLLFYKYSLTAALFTLFLGSFVAHAFFGLEHYNEERLLDGLPPVKMAAYVGSSQFWFESFQNWQSEFLSIAMVVVLSVYLRQIGSPESKPVHAPHFRTGKD